MRKDVKNHIEKILLKLKLDNNTICFTNVFERLLDFKKVSNF